MTVRPIPGALLLVLLTAACANYSDRVAVRTESLPQIHLASLQGQDIALEVTDSRHRPRTLYTKFLQDDLERSLTKAGVNVTAAAPLQLNVTIDYLDSDFRAGRWESCAHLTGQLIRDGSIVATPIAKFCQTETVNPWQVPETQRAGINQDESRSRAYYGVVRAFLTNLEKSTAQL